MAISRSMDNRNEEFEHENVISLKHFPPKLRKLARFMLESEEKKTVSEACRDLNLNIKSIFTLIHRSKQNGNDFNEFIENISDSYLNLELINVDKATVKGALEGTARDREIYYKRINKLKEPRNIEITSNLSLTYAVNVDNIETSSERKKGENSLIPYIPKKS
jgi:hypothetical protein